MVTIPRQFNGPPDSGNGGWVSGLVAQARLEQGHTGPVTSRLRMPPPLDTPLAWEHDADETRLMTHGGALVGTSAPGSFTREPPPFLDAKTVQTGYDGYPGFTTHPFDQCFTCGTGRGEGDGLRIFTGPVGDDLTGAPWHVHEAFGEDDGAVGVPVAWAALDCPGGWAADFSVQPMVLGTMTAEVYSAPVVGETYHAIGQLAQRDGRKFFTSTALYTPDGELVGRSEQVWIEIDVATFGR
ncbi:hypothetical protein IDH50_08330 [Aeromicrobium tamlense]|uniref:Thioesterase family protein n=1 Tax=Aeromicrobium tamlense TaxID=375541 RepID=A0A8I0KMZ7_9ACTN|nr:hypothetical protein [Aeromicrobium tamlense]MBD1270234.1 hypothetical protein [Aeromicrobium tamlense]NYI39108.1 hypothetical protein [Aeromicrobium tamlense]